MVVKKRIRFFDMGQRGQRSSLANPPTDFLRVYSPQDKNLNWNQVKRKYPQLNPRGDADADGFINSKDCKPLDPTRDGIFEAIAGAVGSVFKKKEGKESFGQRVSRGFREGMARPNVIQRYKAARAASQQRSRRLELAHARSQPTRGYIVRYAQKPAPELTEFEKRKLIQSSKQYANQEAPSSSQEWAEAFAQNLGKYNAGRQRTVEQVREAAQKTALRLMPQKEVKGALATGEIPTVESQMKRIQRRMPVATTMAELGAEYKQLQKGPIYRQFAAAQKYAAMQHPTLGPKIRRASRISRLEERNLALAVKASGTANPAEKARILAQIEMNKAQLKTTREAAATAATTGRASKIRMVSNLGKEVFPMMGSRAGLQIPATSAKGKTGTGRRGRPVGSYSSRWAAYGGVIRGRKARSIARRQALMQQQRMVMNPQYRRMMLQQLRRQQLQQQVMPQRPQVQQPQQYQQPQQQITYQQTYQPEAQIQRAQIQQQYLTPDEIARLQEIRQMQQQMQMQQAPQEMSVQPQEGSMERPIPPMSAFQRNSRLPGFTEADRMQADRNLNPLQPGEYIDPMDGRRKFRPLPQSEKWIQ